MEEYIDDLLRRMADEEAGFGNRAYDEAKELTDCIAFFCIYKRKIIETKSIYEEQIFIF